MGQPVCQHNRAAQAAEQEPSAAGPWAWPLMPVSARGVLPSWHASATVAHRQPGAASRAAVALGLRRAGRTAHRRSRHGTQGPRCINSTAAAALSVACQLSQFCSPGRPSGRPRCLPTCPARTPRQPPPWASPPGGRGSGTQSRRGHPLQAGARNRGWAGERWAARGRSCISTGCVEQGLGVSLRPRPP